MLLRLRGLEHVGLIQDSRYDVPAAAEATADDARAKASWEQRDG